VDKKGKKKVNNGKVCGKTNRSEDIYGYDFVPELANVLNIDEQKEKAKELEDIDRKS